MVFKRCSLIKDNIQIEGELYPILSLKDVSRVINSLLWPLIFLLIVSLILFILTTKGLLGDLSSNKGVTDKAWSVFIYIFSFLNLTALLIYMYINYRYAKLCRSFYIANGNKALWIEKNDPPGLENELTKLSKPESAEGLQLDIYGMPKVTKREILIVISILASCCLILFGGNKIRIYEALLVSIITALFTWLAVSRIIRILSGMKWKK